MSNGLQMPHVIKWLVFKWMCVIKWLVWKWTCVIKNHLVAHVVAYATCFMDMNGWKV